MAQSRLRQPFRNSATAPVSKSTARNGGREYTAALTQIVADTALLSIAALLGFLADVYLFSPESKMDEPGMAFWVPAAFVVVAAVFLKIAGSQKTAHNVLSLRDWAQTAGVISLAGVVVWGAYELIEPGRINTEMAISVWASAVVLLPVGQAAVRQFMRSRGIGCKHLVVVGDMDRAMPLIEELSKSGSTYRVAGVVSVASMPGRLINMSDIQEEQPVSTRDLNELPEVMDESQATEVLIAVSNEKYSEVRETVRKTVSADVNVHVAIDPLLQEATSGEPEMVEGIPAVRFKGKKMPWQYETIKRAFDFTAALTLLILASPLLAVVAFAVKLDSPGPIFFKQVRVGRRGQKFGMYKFRSMKPNAEALLADLMEQNEASGQMFKMRNDPRITRVGKILRKLSIDELPQLFNVLNGTMSLVGPRPPLPKEVADYEDWHYERLDGVPGITGLWQVKRGPVLDFLEMVNYDLEYLRNWSLAKDIYILLKTVPVVITGRGAY